MRMIEKGSNEVNSMKKYVFIIFKIDILFYSNFQKYNLNIFFFFNLSSTLNCILATSKKKIFL